MGEYIEADFIGTAVQKWLTEANSSNKLTANSSN